MRCINIILTLSTMETILYKKGTNGIQAAKLEQHKHNEMLQKAPSDVF